MTHYLADWIAQTTREPMSIERWNGLVDLFDVERLAEQVKSTGAGYYIISIGQNSGYYLSPNSAYDKLTGLALSKLSRRDLVADLYEPLHKRGIRLMVYLPSGAPGGDKTAERSARMAEWAVSQQRVPGEMGADHPRVVDAVGQKGLGLVVRRLLLAEHHVPHTGRAQLRELRRRGPGRESRGGAGLQPRRHSPPHLDHAV
jgi:hypothetical protein